MIWGTKQVKKEESTYDLLEKHVWDFFMHKVPRLGFEQREGQEDMALDICYSIREQKHTIVEAGVGIGKSYAYIVPLLLYNQLFKKPVLIATSTIALQEQLLKDVRRIAYHLNIEPDIVLAKGMTHFACIQRSAQKYEGADVHDETEDYLYRYIKRGIIDRKSIPLTVEDELWEDVAVKASAHSKCEYFATCKFMELRESMLSTKGIILCNQDLLTVHLQKLKKGQKGLLSSQIDVIVIDEAHNIEDKVRNSLIESYTQRTMYQVIYDAIHTVQKTNIKIALSRDLHATRGLIDKLFEALTRQMTVQIEANKQTQYKDIEKFFIDTHAIKAVVKGLQRKVATTLMEVGRYSEMSANDEVIAELQNANTFLLSLLNDKGDDVFWLEQHSDSTIFACPKRIDKEIRKLYFDQTKTTILTSATIADKKSDNEEESYEYFIKRTGFQVNEGFLAQPKDSPFPYDEHALIYYTNNMPHPTHERSAFIKEGSQEIIKLLHITKGKALILFTSKEDLNEVYRLLKQADIGYTLLRQNKLSSQDEILAAFKADKHSVLLATGTFWEGIDVPGEALSNLIIFRLPFAVPDPINEYKKQLSRDFFMEVSVPDMIVKLRQGVGRLIRKHDDKGIVALLDSRLGDDAKNNYKEIVFDALPMKHRVSDLKAVQAFVTKNHIV